MSFVKKGKRALLLVASLAAMANAPMMLGPSHDADAYFSPARTYSIGARQIEESVQPASEDNSMSVVAQDGQTTVGSMASVAVIISNAPVGVAGFSIEVSLSDPTVARIASVDFPEFGLTTVLPSSDSSVRFAAADLFRKIEAGGIDSVLGTVRIEGFAQGTTRVELNIIQMDDDNGDIMEPLTVAGTVNVD